MKVCVVDAAALARLDEYGDPEHCAQLQVAMGLRQGMRFLLDDDGAPVRDANRWLCQLPMLGCHSPATWDAYARDFCEWKRWLRARGQHELDATKQEIADYHADRTSGALDRRLSPSSWNRLISALDSFYAWAHEDGLIPAVPFTYRNVRGWGMLGRPAVVRRNNAMEKNGRAHATLMWLEPEHLSFFLDVGMNGLGTNGRDDPAFRGRDPARNRAIANLMATAGFRQSEVSLTLIYEVPTVPERPLKFVEWNLPAPICKGRVARKVLVPRLTLQDVHGYIEMERSLVAEQKPWRPARPLLVTEPQRDRGRVGGRMVRWETLTREERLRLVLADGSAPTVQRRGGEAHRGGMQAAHQRGRGAARARARDGGQRAGPAHHR